MDLLESYGDYKPTEVMMGIDISLSYQDYYDNHKRTKTIEYDDFGRIKKNDIIPDLQLQALRSRQSQRKKMNLSHLRNFQTYCDNHIKTSTVNGTHGTTLPSSMGSTTYTSSADNRSSRSGLGFTANDDEYTDTKMSSTSIGLGYSSSGLGYSSSQSKTESKSAPLFVKGSSLQTTSSSTTTNDHHAHTLSTTPIINDSHRLLLYLDYDMKNQIEANLSSLTSSLNTITMYENFQYHLFHDVKSSFHTTSVVLQKFHIIRCKLPKKYQEAYFSLSLTEIIAKFLQIQLLSSQLLPTAASSGKENDQSDITDMSDMLKESQQKLTELFALEWYENVYNYSKHSTINRNRDFTTTTITHDLSYEQQERVSRYDADMETTTTMRGGKMMKVEETVSTGDEDLLIKVRGFTGHILLLFQRVVYCSVH
jgi:hypothetical protein